MHEPMHEPYNKSNDNPSKKTFGVKIGAAW